jgi:hypothetical protein
MRTFQTFINKFQPEFVVDRFDELSGRVADGWSNRDSGISGSERSWRSNLTNSYLKNVVHGKIRGI